MKPDPAAIRAPAEAVAIIANLHTRLEQAEASLRATAEACAAHATENATLKARVAVLEEAGRKSRSQFDFYIAQHIVKNPPDENKAAVNLGFVEMWDDALNQKAKP